jgi:peptidoglycan/LPS O-acetylase OafA/YrhL
MKPTRIDSLTGIRAVAALSVVIFHARELDLFKSLSFGWFSRFVERGYLGVDLFFLLSGFVISFVHQGDFSGLEPYSPNRLVRFLGLRLARIYPVHVTTLGTFVVMFALGGYLGLNAHVRSSVDGSSLSTTLAHLALIHAWGFSGSSWNVPSWSVSAEWFAYLTFPFTAAVIARVRAPVINIALSMISLAGMWAFARWLHAESIDQWTFSHALVRVFVEFTVGCFLYNLYISDIGWVGHPNARVSTWLAIVALVSLFALFAIRAGDFYVVPVLAMLIYALAGAQGRIAYLFGNDAVVHLGEISYSIYMVHALVGLVTNQLTRRVLPGGLAGKWSLGFPLLVFELLVVVLSAQVLYSYIELPARTGLRARFLTARPQH